MKRLRTSGSASHSSRATDCFGQHAVEAICGKHWKPKVLPLFFEQVKRDLAG